MYDPVQLSDDGVGKEQLNMARRGRTDRLRNYEIVNSRGVNSDDESIRMAKLRSTAPLIAI